MHYRHVYNIQYFHDHFIIMQGFINYSCLFIFAINKEMLCTTVLTHFRRASSVSERANYLVTITFAFECDCFVYVYQEDPILSNKKNLKNG